MHKNALKRPLSLPLPSHAPRRPFYLGDRAEGATAWEYGGGGSPTSNLKTLLRLIFKATLRGYFQGILGFSGYHALLRPY